MAFLSNEGKAFLLQASWSPGTELYARISLPQKKNLQMLENFTSHDHWLSIRGKTVQVLFESLETVLFPFCFLLCLISHLMNRKRIVGDEWTRTAIIQQPQTGLTLFFYKKKKLSAVIRQSPSPLSLTESLKKRMCLERKAAKKIFTFTLTCQSHWSP